MAPETPSCPRCGNTFSTEQVEGDFAGICPRCLAGLMKSDPGAEIAPVTDNAKIRIDTIRPPLQPGALFKGFEVLEILGKGGMGVVYKARQQSLDRLVALKLLNAQLASSEEFSKRFDREAKVLASLNHPNVVHVHDFGREDGLLYLVMEHVDGPTLDDVLRRKPVDPTRFLTSVRDVSKGLQRVHEAGLVHRDIKPSNILLTREGTAKISDFGLAIETEETQKLTQSGMFVGTPHYVSPEHAQGKKVDGRSDLYSLGIILFEGFAGRPPFQAASATALLLKHVNEAPPALYKLAPQSPKIVQEVVRKLLAKNPAARHDTAASLVRDLDRALEELKAGPRPIPAIARKAPAAAPVDAAPKLPMKWIAAGGAVALGLLVLFVAIFSGKSEPKKGPKSLEQQVAMERPVAPPSKAIEEEKPKEPEAVPLPAPTPETSAPKPQEPKTPSALEEALHQGEKLFEKAKASYEDGKARSSVETLAEAGFKAEEARAKFSAVQEIGGDDLKAKGAEQFKLVQQFLKLVNEARLAIQNSKGVPAAAAPVQPSNPAAPATDPVAVPVMPAARPVPARKEPLPEAAALKESEKTIREVYKADYAKKSASDQQALAAKLLSQGRTTTDDPRAQFVLFREARDLALQAGDLDTMLAAIEEMSKSFDVDIVATKNAALTKIQVRSPEATSALAEALINLTRDAMDADNFDVAGSAAARADSLPKAAADATLTARTSDLRKEVAAVRDEYLKVKSSIDKPGTGDQEALGRYHAFVKGDWERGLPILASSAKPPLNALAEKDQGRPEEAAAQIETGDGWWDLAEKEKAPIRKARLQERAKYWYETAFSSATGLGKTKIEKRLDALDAAMKGPVDLIKLIDPRVDTINGSWKVEKGSLISSKEWYGRLQIRYQPPEEYDLRLVVERRDHDEDFIVGLAKGDTQITANLDAGHCTYSAFGIQATRADQSPQYNGKLFTENRPSILICSVRKKSVSVTVDGKKVLTYAWKGDEARSLIANQWEIPNRKIFFVGAHGTSFAVHSILLVPVSGAGHVDRSLGISAPAASRNTSGSAAPVVAPKGSIDLLALVDPKLDAVRGDFSREQGGLLTPPGTDYARIHLPFAPPAEYELMVEGFRRTDGDCLGIGLPDGDRQGMVMLAGLDGGTCGLEMIDGFNYMLNNTKVTGLRLELWHAFKVVCSVRRTGIDVSLDGKPIIHWSGDGKRLAVWDRWQVPQKNVPFLGSQGSSFHITQAVLTPLSGQGAYLRKPAVIAGTPLPKGSSTDLLALVDLSQDLVEGDWSLDGGVLQSGPGQHVRLQLPVLAPEEYDLKVVLTRTEGNDGMAFGLTQGPAQWTVFVDKFPQEGSQSGLEMVDNGMLTLVRGNQVSNNQPITFEFKVRRGGFSVLKDGKAFLQWQGNSSRLTNFARWVVKNPRTLFLGQWENRIRYTEIKLTAVSGEGRLLRGGAPAPVTAPRGSLDLLPLIDPKLDGVQGEFTRDGAGLRTPSGIPWARIMVPYAPPAEYDLMMVVERKENTNSLNLALPWNKRQVSLVIEGKGPGIDDVSALDFIDGKEFFRNETTTKGPFLLQGKSSTIVISVRKSSFGLVIDGRSIFTWKGDSGRIAEMPALKVPVKDLPVIGCYDSGFLISQLLLTPVSGTGTPLRRPAAPAPAKPGIDLLALVDPKRDSSSGTWKLEKGALISPVGAPTAFQQIPYAPPEEYDLRIEAARREGQADFYVGVVGGGKQMLLHIDGGDGRSGGLQWIEDKDWDNNETTYRNDRVFVDEKSRILLISVRRDNVTVTGDGRTLINWKADYKRVKPVSAVANTTALYIGDWESSFQITQIQLIPVSGAGKKIR